MPTEIDSGCRRIQAGWTDEQFVMKEHGCRRDAVAWYSEYRFDDHVVRIVSNGMVDRREYD